MRKSLIEELPKIIADGKKEVEEILERISSSSKIGLQTNELVLPAKDTSGLFKGNMPSIDEKDWLNRLIYGDNLLIIQALLSGDEASGLSSMRGKIDLIYIDPPFDSKADYRTKVILPGVDVEQRPTVIEQFAYADTWKDGTVSYLRMLYPRLVLMRELLSEKGSIYVHIDWHVGHYVKVLLDEIFGRDHFRNEIIWKYTGSRSPENDFAKKHDTIFRYGKSLTPKFFPLYTAYAEGTIARFDQEDEDGRFKVTYRDGKEYKTYMKEGKQLEDVWMIEPVDLDVEDVPIVMKNAKENTDYSTQKPKLLIERLIKSATEKGDIVADFFMGSGTTGAVAESMGRRWIMTDLGKPACYIGRKRLVDQNSKPFLYQSIGDYQKESFVNSKLYRRVGDLSQVVLQLYGAIPFADTEQHQKNLGYIKESRTLVYVDSPNKVTGLSTLKRAQELRNTFMGGWKKVVVLGWNFTHDIVLAKGSLDDENLDVAVIPPDLIDRLKTKSSYKKLIESGKIRFSSPQYLVADIAKANESDNERIKIKLDYYAILSPDILPLGEDDKEKLSKILASDSLSLIEYWNVDPDYDGITFRSRWQDYRGNTSNDNDPLRVVYSTELIVPQKTVRKICIKAVDVFGFESVVIKEI